MVLVILQVWLAAPAMAVGGACLPADPIERPNSLGSIVSESYPIRVHWLRDQDQEKAVDILDYAELSWAVQIDDLGFVPPLLPDGADGPELDFYLAPAWNNGGVTYGDDRVDHVTGDGMNGTTSFIVIDWDYPIMGLPSLVPHEFQHASQYATDFNEATFPIWEGVATAAQEWTLSGTEPSYWDWDIAGYQEAPWLPALTADGFYAFNNYGLGWSYEYGSVLWVMHLDQVLGTSDGSVGAALWRAVADEGSGLEPDVLDAFASVAQQPLGEALNELARTRWLVGDDWDSRGLDAAESWPSNFKVPADNATFGELPLQHSPDPQPQSTGQSFLSLTGLSQAAVGSDLVVQARSSAGLDSAVLVLWWSIDGDVGQLSASGLDPQVSLPLADVDRVVVALTNLGPAGLDADVDPLYAFGDQIIAVYIADAGSESPGTSSTSTDPRRSAPPDSELRGCGCRSADLPSSFWLCLFWLPAFVRRR